MSQLDQSSNVAPTEVDAKWLSFELLPGRYRMRRRAHRILAAWSAVALMLFAGLCGTTTAFWLRGKSIKARHAKIAADAKPIHELKTKVLLLEQSTERIEGWNTAIESARPDDSVLQVLATVASATATDQTIDVESVDLKLALEHVAASADAPTWALPRLQVTARVPSRDAAEAWAKRINLSDRVIDASVRTSPRSPNQKHDNVIQISGNPQATRVLP